MSRELDEACAKALGYATLWAEDSVFGAGVYLHDAGAVRESESVTANCHLLGGRWERLKVNGAIGEYYVRMCPAFGEDHKAARMLEDEIERRDRRVGYIVELGNIVLNWTAHDGMALYPALSAWALLRATPEQRARAFLDVMNNA